MIRFAARAAALLALLGVWGLSSSDRFALPLPEATTASASPSLGQGTPNLARLGIFNQVVLRVRDNYFDPSRIDPQQMLIDALDAVEKQVPEVMVDGDTRTGEVKVTVGSATQTFAIDEVDTIFKVSLRLSQIMGFVQKNLDPGHSDETLRNIEYALANGMLSSLDPHSVLLKPEYFREMKMSTRGEFGGLGFIIAMKEGDLTVVRVLRGTESNPTPAYTAGIRPNDRILKIGDESTVNMDVSEAAQRLRGRPGSKIGLTLMRKGWDKPKHMVLPRAKIEIESVISRLLDGNVGYVRIKSFQGNTTRMLHAALRDLKAQAGGKLAGLVLDLRSNPGGLLEQAIQVSDTFLSAGEIVTTVGMNNQLKEVKRASDQRNADLERDLPLAVLVNGGSASASEIVAGALKQLDRAILIGRPTFGKGSVQVLYDLPDESALKLTVAQYLTPGDISIQETGIIPDVELIASRVEKEGVNAFAPIKTMREEDLERHLQNPADLLSPGAQDTPVARKADPQEQPTFRLRYLRDKPPVQEDEEEDEDFDFEDDELGDEFFEDFQIRFASDLLRTLPRNKRSDLLQQMGPFMEERVQGETSRIEEAIASLGVDWSAGSGKALESPSIAVSFEPTAVQTVKAGEEVQLTLRVTNTGKETIHRLHAWTEAASNPLIDRREFLFGTIPPGETRSWSVSVELPKDVASRKDPLRIHFQDPAGTEYEPFYTELNLAELPKPRFAYTWQIVEEDGGGDGIPHPGKRMKMLLDVRNVGPGPSSDTTFASIKNKGNEKIFIEKGRYRLGEIPPDGKGHGVFEFELKEGYDEDVMPIQLLIYDDQLGAIALEELRIPVEKEPLPFQPGQRLVKAPKALELLAAARDGAPILATIPEGASILVDGSAGTFSRVRWGEGRFGFVSLPETLPAGGASASDLEVEPGVWRTPPRIAFDQNVSQGGIAVDGERFSISGVAEGPRLRDVYVFVNDQKVYFAPVEEGTESLRFVADFPLKEGSNHVVVVAREANEVTSRRALTVLRREAGMSPSAKRPQEPAPPSP